MNMKHILLGMLLFCSCTNRISNSGSGEAYLTVKDSVLIQHVSENNGVKANFIVDTTLTRLYLEDEECTYNAPNVEVKTATDAYLIAEPYFLSTYHGDFELQKPLHINLINDAVWVVYGYPQPIDGTVYFGGDMYMEIQKKNGVVSKIILGE